MIGIRFSLPLLDGVANCADRIPLLPPNRNGPREVGLLWMVSARDKNKARRALKRKSPTPSKAAELYPSSAKAVPGLFESVGFPAGSE